MALFWSGQANIAAGLTPGLGRAANREAAPRPRPPPDWNIPASPKAGPVGPIFAVEFVNTFNRLPKPCLIKISSPRNEIRFNNFLADNQRRSQQCCDLRFAKDEPLPGAGEPERAVNPTEPGLVVHWNQDFKPGEDVVHYLNTANSSKSQSSGKKSVKFDLARHRSGLTLKIGDSVE